MAKGNSQGDKNLINNQTSLIEDQNEGEPVTTRMDVYKAKIQSDGSLDKLKLRTVVRGDYCSWCQVELTSTWNPHTPCIHGYVTTETYPILE